MLRLDDGYSLIRYNHTISQGDLPDLSRDDVLFAIGNSYVSGDQDMAAGLQNTGFTRTRILFPGAAL